MVHMHLDHRLRGVIRLAVALLIAVTTFPARAEVVIDWVTVGDAGNAADDTTFGAVNYDYKIAKYEVTLGQYMEFLNAKAKSDPYGLYNATLATNNNSAGITRAGSSGSYTYTITGPVGSTPSGANSPLNRPVTYVSWYDAARFANWMNNGQGSSDTETGAYRLSNGQVTAAQRTSNVITYTLAAPSALAVGDQVSVSGLTGAGFNSTFTVASVSGSQFTVNGVGSNATATGTGTMNGSSAARLAGAEVYLPTENEWYKAAFYKGGGTNAGYWEYATGTNTAPGNNLSTSLANGANFAPSGKYSVTQIVSYNSGQNYLTNVGAFSGSDSAYGTYDQNGNVWEFTETMSGINRVIRGGSWEDQSAGDSLSASFGASTLTNFESYQYGFRISAIPEPSTVALLAAGSLAGVGYVTARRRKRKASAVTCS